MDISTMLDACDTDGHPKVRDGIIRRYKKLQMDLFVAREWKNNCEESHAALRAENEMQKAHIERQRIHILAMNECQAGQIALTDELQAENARLLELNTGLQQENAKFFTENARLRAEQDLSQKFTEVHLATRHGAFASEEDFPCPRCGGQVGHRVNCPRGIAFSNPPGENR